MTSFPGTNGNKPTAVIFANPNTLALGIAKHLIGKGLSMKAVTSKPELWRKDGALISAVSELEIIELKEEELKLTADYLILILGFSEQETKEEEKLSLAALSLAKDSDAKTLLVAPYLQSEDFRNSQTIDFVKENAKRKRVDLRICYVGEALGPWGLTNQKGPVSETINDLLLGKNVVVPKGERKLYPVHINSLLESLERILFSFSPDENEIAVITEGITFDSFINELEKFWKTKILKKTGREGKYYSPEVKRVKVESGLTRALDEVFASATRSSPQERKAKKKKSERQKKEKKKILNAKKFTMFSFSVFLLVFLVPFYALLATGSALFLAKESLDKGSFESANKFFVFAQASSNYAERRLISYSEIPLIGEFFTPGAYLSDILERVSIIGQRAVLLARNSSVLFGKMLGNEPYDTEVIAQDIAVDLESLYKELGFLQGEISVSFGLSKKVLGAFSANEGVLSLREKVLLTKELVEELPRLLGSEEKKTYLVLFQNNMELRPTGGFIGSFALASFENGRLIDVSIQDVYSADGQLKGHVEPPQPIRDYLGEANWYLRDSNWDPDFPTSAQRAEWFLNKELDVSVDGVIGIDLEVAKELLKHTGPILVSDFNQLVDYSNIYEKTQYEVEKDFFPGSKKKANFLTALARELLVEFSNMKPSEYLKTATSIFNSFNSRHIQVFLHNAKASRVISELGWDGAVKLPTCSGNCFADFLSIVEANVGVNKANYFIQRNPSLIVTFEGDRIERLLSVSFVNKASPLLGEIAKYETYVRVIVPQESEFIKVEFIRGAEKENLAPSVELKKGIKEAGVLITVDPGKTRTLNFYWSQEETLDFETPGFYSLYWRKQAGTSQDPALVRLFFPKELEVYANPSFSLTDAASRGYNFLLTGDLVSKVSW